MRTLLDFCRNGIRDVFELGEALQLAMQIELATIPPYLCAQWSVKSDPHRIEGVLHYIVNQEMNHLALAGNLLTSIGGTPRIAHHNFLPEYPLTALPGGIVQKQPIDLRPLSFNQVQVFMQIEHPAFPPVAFLMEKSRPATIGEFYESIIAAFETIQPTILPNAHQIPVAFSKPIRTISDAVSVVARIMTEGEGTPSSPNQHTPQSPSLAHYYQFKEIYKQRRLIQVNGDWQFSGEKLIFPEVYDFTKAFQETLAMQEFRKALTQILLDLHYCWYSGDALNVSNMFKVHELGRALVRDGIQPEFKWLE